MLTERQRITNERLQQYARFQRAYLGFSVRGVSNTSVVRDWKRIKFNFIKPVVDLSAGWFAAQPIDWDIDNNPDATKEAYAIWDRSGSDRALLENALACSIYGDLVGLATADDQQRPKIEFVDPNIATPLFDGADYSCLRSLEIAYEQMTDNGEVLTRREMWEPHRMEAFVGDKQVREDSRTYDFLPAVWIRNSSVKGLPFGISDVEPILELVEEYDHLASKQTRIVDYYASPNIYFSGASKPTAGTDKQVGTVYYLPENGKAGFLEWSGPGPAIEDQLTRVRNAIAEVSQVPAVAFGQADSGATGISGVAIKILYGPLTNKALRKAACWGPCLEYLMWLCLRQSGFKNLSLEEVNASFQSAIPVDDVSITTDAVARVGGGILSKRSAMNQTGVENPETELKRIITEQQIAAHLEMQNMAARQAVMPQKPPMLGQMSMKPAAAAQPMEGSDLEELLQRFDALIEAETVNIAETEAPEGSGAGEDDANE
jgi:hypothetical protein